MDAGLVYSAIVLLYHQRLDGVEYNDYIAS